MAPAFELRSLFDSCREPRAMKWDRHNVGEFTRQWNSCDQRELDLMTFPSAPSSPKQIKDLNPPENLHSRPVTTKSFGWVSVGYLHQLYAEMLDNMQKWGSTQLPILQSLSSALGFIGFLPCESEVFAAPSEVQTIRIFRGKVERVDGDVAYVTLTDERGRETFADCSAAELEGRGISEGKFFECRIEDRSAETVVTIDPIPERRLSRREWKDLSDRVRESLSGYDLNDDY